MEGKMFYRYASSRIVKLDEIEDVVNRNERFKRAILTANNERMSRQKLRMQQFEEMYKKEDEIKNSKLCAELNEFIIVCVLLFIGFCIGKYIW